MANNIVKAFLVFAGYILINFFLSFFFKFLLRYDFFYNLDEPYYYYVDTLFYFILLLIISKILFKTKTKHLCKDININILILMIIVAILCFFINDPIYRFYQIIGKEDYPSDFSLINPTEMTIRFFNIVFLASVTQELIFRRYIIGIFNHVKSGLLISSILFALIHVNIDDFEYSVISFLSNFIFGVIVGYIYIKTRQIIYPIIVHSLFNLIWFVVRIYIEEYWMTIKSLNFDYRYWGIIGISGILLIYILSQLHLLNKRKRTT